MIYINNVIVNDEVVQEEFSCNLSACKGACCWEGDYGAPLEEDEKEWISKNLDLLKPLLSLESQELIDKKGAITYYEEPKFFGTSLHKNGACVFLTMENNIATCSIEKAYREGITVRNKPISCHLYPIRIEKNFLSGFETLNYDKWDICSAACEKGKKEKIKIHQFAKDALIRKYGNSFYEQLTEAVKVLNEE